MVLGIFDNVRFFKCFPTEIAPVLMSLNGLTSFIRDYYLWSAIMMMRPMTAV